MKADILYAIRGQCEEFIIFFLHSPIVISNTFPLEMMNPKILMSVAYQGLQTRGPNSPSPQYPEVSLRASRDRVKDFL